MLRRYVLGTVLATGALLCACERQGPEDVDAEALDTVALVFEEQLNEPPAAIMAMLRESARQAQVGWDTLYINLEGEPEPVNWWLQRRGFLELSGAQFATRAAFTLTKPITDILAQPDQPWFEAEISGDPSVDCRTPAAMAANGCEIEVEITPTLTAAGRSMIGAPIQPLQPVTVNAIVTLGPEAWEVVGLSNEGLTPRELALAAILGNPEQRQAAARQADDQMRGRLAQLAGETEPTINLEAYTPPNYIDPDPPVQPIAPPKTGGRPDTPFRPGA